MNGFLKHFFRGDMKVKLPFRSQDCVSPSFCPVQLLLGCPCSIPSGEPQSSLWLLSVLLLTAPVRFLGHLSFWKTLFRSFGCFKIGLSIFLKTSLFIFIYSKGRVIERWTARNGEKHLPSASNCPWQLLPGQAEARNQKLHPGPVHG